MRRFNEDVRLQCTFSMKKAFKVLMVLLVMYVLHILIINRISVLETVRTNPVPLPEYDKRARRPGGEWASGRRKSILIWRPFQSDRILDNERHCMMKNCPYQCDLTDDKSHIAVVDAVNFLLTSLWPDNWNIDTRGTIDFPSYRRPDQIWALTNQEPPPNLFGAIDVFNGIFNWTVSYRTDATINFPYGIPKKLTNQEAAHAALEAKWTNVFKTKSRGITGKISNCKDVAHRYRLVEKLQKYLDIDMYGKCYDNVCGDPLKHNSCDNVTVTYKFYLALENSRCKDYVTEKYWWALLRNQIPIVNWDHSHVSRDAVIPNSYISIYDFPDFKSFGEYITKVSNNETLYNSYFDWRKKYKVGGTCASCQVCRGLHEGKQPQYIQNLDRWIRNDTCAKVGAFNDFVNKIDKFIFSNLGI